MVVLLLAGPASAQLPPIPIPSLVPPEPTPAVTPSATPTPTSTASPTVAATPFGGGHVAVTAVADSHGSANETVPAGSFQLTNTTGSPIKVTAVSIAADNPVVLSSLTLTLASGASSQTVTLANPGGGNQFSLSGVEVPAGGVADGTLTATLAAPSEESGSTAQATGGPSPGATLVIVAAAALFAAALSLARGRRRTAATALGIVLSISCYAGCGSEQTSAQTLVDVAAQTNEGGPVTFDGMPASLGSVSRPQPLMLSGSGPVAAPTSSSSSTATPTEGTPAPTSSTRTPATPTPTPAP